MAFLENTITGEKRIINSMYTIGRGNKNDLWITNSDISKMHCVIFWEADRWYLKDHSRNATLVNQRVVHHATIELIEDCEIQFGEEEETVWKLGSLDAPRSYFVRGTDTHKEYIELKDDVFLYPNAENPLVSFFLSPSMCWMMDDGNSVKDLLHREEYEVIDKKWKFISNESMEDTVDQMMVMKMARLDYHISADEESVGIKIIVNDLEMTLGDQIHNHLLLLLARIKKSDVQNEVGSEDQGWIYSESLLHELSRELLQEIDTNYLNIMIHRIRSSFKELKPYGYLFANIIERKRGKLRLNYGNIRIIKENQIQTV